MTAGLSQHKWVLMAYVQVLPLYAQAQVPDGAQDRM